MKTFEQLAQSAYAAYIKHALKGEKPNLTWQELGAERQACWVAAAKQVAAEIAAIH